MANAAKKQPNITTGNSAAARKAMAQKTMAKGKTAPAGSLKPTTKAKKAGGKSTEEAQVISIRQPTIRRVLKQGGLSMCGLCRRRYKETATAQKCLLGCWQQVCESYPLIHRQTGYKPRTGIDTSRSVYRCRFCSRDFFTEEQGLSCAQSCLTACTEKLRKSLNMPTIDIKVRSKLSFGNQLVKVKKDYVSRFAFKRKSAEEEKPAVEQTAGEPEIPIGDSGDPHNKDAAGKGEVIVERRSRDEWPKNFTRQNAKYRCSYCLTDTFTKMEVQACFDGHFDEDGLEIDPNGSVEE